MSETPTPFPPEVEPVEATCATCKHWVGVESLGCRWCRAVGITPVCGKPYIASARMASTLQTPASWTCKNWEQRK